MLRRRKWMPRQIQQQKVTQIQSNSSDWACPKSQSRSTAQQVGAMVANRYNKSQKLARAVLPTRNCVCGCVNTIGFHLLGGVWGFDESLGKSFKSHVPIYDVRVSRRWIARRARARHFHELIAFGCLTGNTFHDK